jgi:hypothetical protein
MKDCFLFTHHPSCMVVDAGEGVIFQTLNPFDTSAGAISKLPCISSCERFSGLSRTYVPIQLRMGTSLVNFCLFILQNKIRAVSNLIFQNFNN